MFKTDSVAKILPALVKAQKKMGAAIKDVANPFYKSKYADLSNVLEVCKGPLLEEGVTIVQSTFSDGENHYVETCLVHESGEFVSSGNLRLELKSKDMQQLGSAITFAKRYSLQSLLSIPSEDDDGNATRSVSKPVEATPASIASPAVNGGGFKKPPRPQATPISGGGL